MTRRVSKGKAVLIVYVLSEKRLCKIDLEITAKKKKWRAIYNRRVLCNVIMTSDEYSFIVRLRRRRRRRLRRVGRKINNKRFTQNAAAQTVK